MSGQTRKGYSEESRDDNVDSTDRAVPLRRYYPKRIRARSRFERVSTTRNEWNRRLRTKTALEQISRTSTSKRDGGICSHHTHDAGERRSKKTNRANLQRFCELILYAKPQPKRGSSTKVELGNARAISKPKNKNDNERKKRSGAGSSTNVGTGDARTISKPKG